MRQIPRFLIALAAALIGAHVSAAPIASGTDSPVAAVSATASPVATPATAPTPVPLAELATQAEVASGILGDIETELTAEQPIIAANGDLPTLLREIDARVSEGKKVLEGGPSLETVRGLAMAWQKLNESLSVWTRDLTRRAAQHDEQIARLGQLAKTWEATSKLAQSSGAPREVLQRVEGLIEKAKKTRDAVQKRLKELWTLQKRAADQDVQITAALAAVEQARGAAVNRLFATDSPPIWNVEVRLGTGRDLVEETLRTQIADLQAYASRESVKFLLNAILFAVLLLCIHWARRRVQPWAEGEPERQHAAVIFDIPVATAAALALVIGGWLHPQAPPLFWALWGAAALVPAILILRRLVEPQLFPVLNALIGFYFFDQLRTIAASLPVLSRLLFLAEMGGGVLFSAWLLLPARAGSKGALQGPSRTIRAGARLATGFFLAASLANALGYVSLANLLGNAVLRSCYLAVILYAAIGIGGGLIMGALSVRPLTDLGMVNRHRIVIWHRMRRIVTLSILVLWAYSTVEMFSLRSSFIDAANGVLTASLTVGSLNLSLGNVLGFGVTVWASFLISRFFRFVLEEDVYPRIQLSRGLPYAISTILHYIVLVIGFFMATAALGIDMTRFTILAGAFGVGMGFGLQNILNNFVSGLILLFERPVKVGDVVQMDAATGVVDRIGIRASIIRTGNGSEIIVPNGKLISDQVINWTLSNRQRGIEISIGVAYGADPCRIIELLQAIAIKHPRVALDPAPKALLVKFGADALEFQLLAWTNHFEEWMQIRSDLAVAINAAFVQEGIAIPYAQRELHLRSIDPEIVKVIGRP
ncbi:MAG: mechanosensitive ion channel domain-containing protein [Verrucomicrobiota bacterium]